MSSSDQASFDIENPYAPLVNSLKEELKSLSQLSSGCSIYKVPEALRDVNAKAYTPRVVSIGPLHYGNERLKAMEEHKKRYLQNFMERTEGTLESYVKAVKEKEAELRGCYAETIQFSSDKFAEIILIDAAFVIELLLRSWFDELKGESERICVQDVRVDMLCLENQVPFFILEVLFDLSQIDKKPSIIELSYKFFKRIILGRGTEDKLKSTSTPKVKHFVDLVRFLHLPSKEQGKGEVETVKAPTVTELHQAGVKFKAGSSRNLFDIHFNKEEGILEIPKLTVGFATEVQLRNIIAYEQLYREKRYMNDYVVFIDRLVSTPKDVDLLVKYGIVENLRADSNEAATLINNLARGALFKRKDFYFASICDGLNKYYRTSWHRWKANLKQNYFNTPWAIISFIAAVVLLLLTLTQTINSLITISWGKQN
ncbi:hypothetical protein CJ030_MR2G013154 [Morella rubra]|uniref:Uncharacterized protein n=1 Tax=Morella rubra TaxID=262757 RepID=A0A6A1WEZ7_9ROSI|nr:hypothetical protein CJ030_MR2G013154 [Morella rubra]